MEQQVVEKIRQAQQGNHAAFRYLVSLYDERITKLIYSIVQNQSDTEDLYQDIFLKVWKQIHTFQFRSDFYSWLYRVAVNTCYNFHASHRRHYWAEVRDHVDQSAVIELTGDRDSSAAAQAVRHAIRKLPTRQRTVVVMHYIEGNPISVIASLLKINDGTIKRYLFRARETMRKELTDYV